MSLASVNEDLIAEKWLVFQKWYPLAPQISCTKCNILLRAAPSRRTEYNSLRGVLRGIVNTMDDMFDADSENQAYASKVNKISYHVDNFSVSSMQDRWTDCDASAVSFSDDVIFFQNVIIQLIISSLADVATAESA